MMKTTTRIVTACAIAIAPGAYFGSEMAQAGQPSARVSAPAPDFSATDSYGRSQKLSDQKGKIVVLEWTNDGCPFVGKHYGSGNMQALQKKYTAQGVVWFTVVSSAPGTQGYVNPAEANRDTEMRGAAPTAVLLDPTGAVGHLYGAQSTGTARLHGRHRRHSIRRSLRHRTRKELRGGRNRGGKGGKARDGPGH